MTTPTCLHCGETDARLIHHVSGPLYQCSICGGILAAEDEPDDPSQEEKIIVAGQSRGVIAAPDLSRASSQTKR